MKQWILSLKMFIFILNRVICFLMLLLLMVLVL